MNVAPKFLLCFFEGCHFPQELVPLFAGEERTDFFHLFLFPENCIQRSLDQDFVTGGGGIVHRIAKGDSHLPCCVLYFFAGDRQLVGNRFSEQAVKPML